MLNGYASLSDICGGPPSLEELAIMSLAVDAWRASEAEVRKQMRASSAPSRRR